jgi:hypothetical protein
MARGKTSGMEGFQTTFDLVGWLKQKRGVIWHSCLTHLDDPAYCFNANLGGRAQGFNTREMMKASF